ncbi:MAG: sigma-70 family RNA polymerase sigma factor [Pirellulales bacterium]
MSPLNRNRRKKRRFRSSKFKFAFMNEPQPIPGASGLEPGKSDESLLRRFRCGQDDAATELYRRYAERLLRLAELRTGQDLAARVQPEDIVQSVFRTFFRRANEGEYEVPDGETLWKLLMVMALNKIRSVADYHRAGKRDVRRTEGLEWQNDQASDESIDVLRMTIADLTSSLPEAHQEMIRLRMEGYTVDEIASKLERSKRTTERVLQAFRSELLEQLKSAGVQSEDA